MATFAASAIVGCFASLLYVDGKLQLSGDFRDESRLSQGQSNLQRAAAEGRLSTFDLFESTVRELSGHEAIWTRKGRFTWDEAYSSVCQFAHYFIANGVTPGDFVALYLLNSAEFMFCWLGLHAIGAAPALINYNLSGKALLHCLEISGAKLIIVDSEKGCQERFLAAELSVHHPEVIAVTLDEEEKSRVMSHSTSPPGHNLRQRKTPLGLMYTSGTTGLPKAYPVGVERAYCTASVRRKTFGQLPGPYGDRSYYAIPFYHGTGGIAAIIDLCGGIPIAVTPRFSVSMFWQDCVDSESTIAMYVGETARYLLATPPSPLDNKHRIRMMWGNGMSPGVWKRFQERFGISEIGEFFASTEGMLTLVNHSRNDLSVGAVGHHGWYKRRQLKNAYVSVQVDPESGDIWRHPQTGFARENPLSEGGEILVKVVDRKAWPGYWRAPEQSEKKFVENVFARGDLWYKTGDALRRNDDGYWYFIDRLGDTFRWKGENVSTTEVSEILGSSPHLADVNIYGIAVPGHEGKAGCAAIVLSSSGAQSNWRRDLFTHARSSLPKYAVPMFVRVLQDSADMSTGNNKHFKAPFQAEGIDIASFGQQVANGKTHALFWLKPGYEEYQLFKKDDLRDLQSGLARL